MACFYVIYRYVFSKWRSIRPVEINQYDVRMSTHHYDNTMGNDNTRDVHCDNGNDVDGDIHCDKTMSNDIAMCVYKLLVNGLKV